MKRPGHKPACKCVGCSPATRKRGMAKLKNWARKHRNKDAKYPRDVWGGGSRKARRKKVRSMFRLAKGEPSITARYKKRYGNAKRSRHGNPIVPDWLTARKTAIAMSRSQGRFYYAKKAPGGYEIMASKAAPFGRRKLGNRQWSLYDAFPTRAGAVSAARDYVKGYARGSAKAKVKHAPREGRLQYQVFVSGGSYPNRKKGPYKMWRGKQVARARYEKAKASRRYPLVNPGQWRTIGKVEEAARASKLAKALRKRTPKAETRILPESDGLYHVQARLSVGSHSNPRKRRNPAYGYGAGTRVTWNRKRRRNPSESGQTIGTAPSLTVSGQGALQFPLGVLKTGPDANTVRLILGGSPAPRPGSRVTRVEYDDPVKAVNAYKEIGRFRHDCADPFIVGPSDGGSVLLASKSKAWKGD